MNKNVSEWDVKLPYAKFPYNRTLSFSTSRSTFDVNYGVKSQTLLDLKPIPIEPSVSIETKKRAEEIKKLH